LSRKHPLLSAYPQHVSNSGKQFTFFEGLGQLVIRTGIQALDTSFAA
jgi:hypothetical protein